MRPRSVLNQLPDQEWAVDAACQDMDQVIFFPNEERRGHSSYKQARSICKQCPVREPCLDYALRHFDNQMDYGMWGGTTPRERRQLRGRRRGRIT